MPELPFHTEGRIAAGSTPASSHGVTVTNPAAANTKGAYATIIASTSIDCKGMIISLQLDSTVGGVADERILADIAIGAAASETVILPNLLAGGNGYTTVHHNHVYTIPYNIAAGTRISARFQSTRASGWGALYCHVTLLENGPMGLVDGGTLLAYGISTATSLGTSIDPGATANTKGTYTSIATTSAHHRKIWVAFGSQNADNTSQNLQAWTFDLATDSSGNTVVIPDLPLWRHFATSMNPGVYGPLDVDLPTGSTLFGRLQCSNNTTGRRQLYVAVYGIG